MSPLGAMLGDATDPTVGWSGSMTNDNPTPTQPTLLITPRRAALLADHANTLDVLVQIQAPPEPADAPPRHRLNLALVIDRSGSMSGRPLQEAKRCAEFVLDGLHSDDRLALVVYDDGVDTLIPAVKVGEAREVIRRAIRQVDSGGSTNLHGGWYQGVQTLLPHVAPAVVSRVILLSDGCANAGLCDPPSIWRQCQETAQAGVGTSTYGLGQHFNEDLMIGMARAGHGNSYYGDTVADLMDPFREEFELLNALCARRLQLEVVPVRGVKARLLNSYASAGDGTWWLPDLAHAGEAWGLLRLKVPTPAASPMPLATVALRYNGLDGEPRAIQPQSLALPVLPAATYQAIAEDELVVRRLGELEAAELQARARSAALRGDWDTVMHVLRHAEKLGAENPWLEAIVAELRKLAERRDRAVFAKESAYHAHRLNTRLAASDERRDVHASAAAYLRRKSNQGKADDPTPRREP